MLKKFLLPIISIAVVLSFVPYANAICKGKFFNPITDIDWWGMFPIKIGGITIVKGSVDSPHESTGSPICICGKPPTMRIGLKVSFWDPARIAETNKDPWCSDILGKGLSDHKGFLGGMSNASQNQNGSDFAQAHWIWIDVFQLIGMALDAHCFENGGFDYAYFTEVDPMWNDDILNFITDPESLLFANPIAQIACSIDSVKSTLGVPLDYMFWCMGAWGSAYPLTGHYSSQIVPKANAAIAARLIYRLSRLPVGLWDHATNYCNPVWLPIWRKTHYRLQEARPRRSGFVIPIGRTPLAGWGYLSNPPITGGKGASDNFMWIVFEEKKCCFGVGF